MYCRHKKCCSEIINFTLTSHCSSVSQFSQFISFCGQKSLPLLLNSSFPRAFSPTASRRYHVKLLSEQSELHSIPVLLFLTSGDTVTVDLSSPIKEEVSHFSAPGCQHFFSVLVFFSLKHAILWEIKSWCIKQQCSQTVASLTTRETTLDVWCGVLLLVVTGCFVA